MTSHFFILILEKPIWLRLHDAFEEKQHTIFNILRKLIKSDFQCKYSQQTFWFGRDCLYGCLRHKCTTEPYLIIRYKIQTKDGATDITSNVKDMQWLIPNGNPSPAHKLVTNLKDYKYREKIAISFVTNIKPLLWFKLVKELQIFIEIFLFSSNFNTTPILSCRVLVNVLRFS